MSNHDIVNPACVPDAFATDIASVENLGGVLRLVFVAPGIMTCGDTNPIERVVVASVVIPQEARQRIARLIGDPQAAALDREAVDRRAEGVAAH